MTLFDTGIGRVRKSAELSECGRYRWWLRRVWGDGNRIVSFVMLNPSTADAEQDDPTIRRCIGFAKSWGYDGLSVRNIYPWRATDPKELENADGDISGGSRGDAELKAAGSADLVVAAWGASGPMGSGKRGVRLLAGFDLHVLGMTANGSPRHPLYVKKTAQPQFWNWRAYMGLVDKW